MACWAFKRIVRGEFMLTAVSSLLLLVFWSLLEQSFLVWLKNSSQIALIYKWLKLGGNSGSTIIPECLSCNEKSRHISLSDFQSFLWTFHIVSPPCFVSHLEASFYTSKKFLLTPPAFITIPLSVSWRRVLDLWTTCNCLLSLSTHCSLASVSLITTC